MRVPVPRYLPNLLSSLRIALAPALVGAAYSNSRFGFCLLLGAALAGDSLDGWLARRWRVASAFGQRLDRWGDGLTMVAGSLGVTFLWLEIVEREWAWALVALAGYAMIGLQRLIEPVAENAAPGLSSKLRGWAVPLSLVPLLAGWAAWPFQAAAVLQAAAGGWKLSSLRWNRRDEGLTAKPIENGGGGRP